MKLLQSVLIFAGILILQIDSHSLPMSKSMLKRISELRIKNELPSVWSYHIHCLYINGDEARVVSALKLREKFIAQFNLTKAEACRSTFDDIRLCMFEIETIPELGSPFISGNWAIMVPVEHFSTTVQWIMQNRGDNDIFVHPNTGAEVSDHINWSLKAGSFWPINIAAFTNQTFF